MSEENPNWSQLPDEALRMILDYRIMLAGLRSRRVKILAEQMKDIPIDLPSGKSMENDAIVAAILVSALWQGGEDPGKLFSSNPNWKKLLEDAFEKAAKVAEERDKQMERTFQSGR